MDLAGVRPLRGDVPERVRCRPFGDGDPVIEADVGVDAGLPRRVLDVLQYRITVGDRLLAVPRPEGVAQRVHVRVGTDPGVAEEIPGSPDGVAGLEDGVVGPRALRLQVVTGTDAGQARTHDQDVEVGPPVCHGGRHQAAAPISLSFRVPCSPKSVALQVSTNSVWCRRHPDGKSCTERRRDGVRPPGRFGPTPTRWHPRTAPAPVPSVLMSVTRRGSGGRAAPALPRPWSGANRPPPIHDPDVNVKLLGMSTATLPERNGSAPPRDRPATSPPTAGSRWRR